MPRHCLRLRPVQEFLFQGTVLEFPSAFFTSTFVKMTSCLPQKQHFGIVSV